MTESASVYAKRQYEYYKKQVKSLKSKRTELEKIEKEFSKNPVQGDPKDYNKKLKKALNAHADALKGDNSFNVLYSSLEEKKEKEVMDDSNMISAHKAIMEAIRELENQITEAQKNADKSWREYTDAKYKEGQVILNGSW